MAESKESDREERGPSGGNAPEGLLIRVTPESALVILQLLVLFITRLRQPRIFCDDAYIHFRNALHWAQGNGMVFNAGQWVLGTTSPIHTAILALLYRVSGIGLPDLAAFFNFTVDVAIMLLALAWMRRVGIGLFFRHALMLSLNVEPWRMLYSNGGMEMSLFILATMLIIECFGRNLWFPGGLLLGALGWIRPEGAVVWAALIASLALTGALRERWRGLAAGGAAAAIIAAFLLHYYGAFIPQSLHAKAGAEWYREKGGTCPLYFFINLGDLTPLTPLNGFEATWGTVMDKINASLVAGAQIFLMAFGAHHFWRRGLRLHGLTCALFMLGYYLFYALANPQIFAWYYVPYYFISLLLAGAGWWALIERGINFLRTRRGFSESAARALQSAMTALLLLLWLLSTSTRGLNNGVLQGATQWSALQFKFIPALEWQKEVAYIRLARRFNKIIGGDHSIRVACTEIGIFGFYYDGQVLDSHGLVSPEALDALKPEIAAKLDPDCRVHPINVWMTVKPEFCLSDQRWVPATPPAFLAAYERLHWPDTTLLIFARKDMIGIIRDEEIQMAGVAHDLN